MILNFPSSIPDSNALGAAGMGLAFGAEHLSNQEFSISNQES